MADGSRFQVRQDEKDMLAEVTRNFPQDLKVTLNFLTIVKSVTFLVRGIGQKTHEQALGFSEGTSRLHKVKSG